MAGRLSKAVLPTDRTIITPSDMNYFLRRTRYGPGFQYMINEGYKWTVAAYVPQNEAVPQVGGEPNNLVEAQFILERYQIEVSVPITYGLKDFLGPDNWNSAEIYMNDPHGPVEMSHCPCAIPGLRTICRIFRVGSVIKPFMVLQVSSSTNLVALTTRLFKIPLDAPVEPVEAQGPITMLDDK